MSPNRGGRPRGSAEERREAIFAALRALLLDKPWGEVTLESVATDAGVSRQTLYNAFGSRNGLAQAYTFHLADALCAVIGDAVQRHPGDPRGGVEEGLRVYLEVAGADPLFARVRSGEAHADLARLVTTDAGPLVLRVAAHLETVGAAAWPDLDPLASRRLARVLARVAVGYVSIPPEEDESPAEIAAAVAAVVAP